MIFPPPIWSGYLPTHAAAGACSSCGHTTAGAASDNRVSPVCLRPHTRPTHLQSHPTMKPPRAATQPTPTRTAPRVALSRLRHGFESRMGHLTLLPFCLKGGQ